MPNYFIQEGKRKGSTLYVLGDHGYIGDKGDHLKYRNSKSLKCPGTAKIVNDGIHLKRNHTCGSKRLDLDVIKRQSELKTLAGKSAIGNKNAFDRYTQTLNNDVATNISNYRGIESAMRMRKLKVIPTLPSCVDEIIDAFSNPLVAQIAESRYSTYFKTVIRSEAHTSNTPQVALAFWGSRTAEKLNSEDTKELFCDATFSTCAKPFYQLLTVHFSIPHILT